MTNLLLLPGLLCDDTVWSDQTPEMAKHNITCSVASYDHADSLVSMAKHVLAKAPKNFALAGHSMGGRVALEIMRLAPHRVTHLALLDTGFQSLASGEAGEKEVAGRMRLLDLARMQGMRVMGQDWLQGMVHPKRLSDESLCDSILNMIDHKTVETFERHLSALIERPDATDVLKTIQCPTLLLSGRQDTWSPLERHLDMAEYIDNSHVVAIENSGHMSTMEQPEAVNEAFIKWLTL